MADIGGAGQAATRSMRRRPVLVQRIAVCPMPRNVPSNPTGRTLRAPFASEATR